MPPRFQLRSASPVGAPLIAPICGVLVGVACGSAAANDRLIATAWFSADAIRCDVGGACAPLFSSGSGGLGLAHSATLGPDGLLYVTSIQTNSVLRYNATTGHFIDEFIAPGAGGLINPTKIAFTGDGRAIVTSFGNDSVLEFDLSGGFVRTLVPGGTAGLDGPESVEIGPDGALYVSSRFTDSIKKFDAQTGAPLGDFITPGSGGLGEPFHMGFSPDGTLAYVGSSTTDTVLEYDGATGAFIRELVIDDPNTPGDETGGLDAPHDATIGPDGHLYVASFGSDRILVYDASTGALLDTITGPGGTLDGPQEVVFQRTTFAEPGVEVIHQFTGEAAGDNFGWVTALIGDLDGDGVDDMIITAPFNDEAGNNAGKVYAYSTNPAADPNTPLFTMTGPAGSNFGINTARAGDLNGDGIEDLLVGAPAAGPGAVFAFSGADGSELWSHTGDTNGDLFGSAVRPAGDLNGDGVSEVAVGAPSDNVPGMPDAGRVFILDGIDGSDVTVIDGTQTLGNFGSSLGLLGDVNGDTIPDIVTAAPRAGSNGKGEGYVISGADQSILCTIGNGNAGVALGSLFSSSPGDTNADGEPDIYITDFQFLGGQGRGSVYEYDNGACNLLFAIRGTAAGEGVGIGNGVAGDLDNDGHDDLLLGIWSSDFVALNAGAVRIHSGRDQSVLRTISSTVAGETLGFDAHGMGDVTGDGVEDMLLSAAWNSAAGFQAGRVYLIEGVDAAPPCRADLTGSSDPNDPSYAMPDGDADGDDFFFYLDAFTTQTIAVCDLTGSSDPNDPTFDSPDGDCDGEDFFRYLDLFVEGCL